MTATLTITDLLRACDEPDVDRFLVLSQLADAYADAGDVLRSDAARWLAERGKWPHDYGDRGWVWWCIAGPDPMHRLPGEWWWITQDRESVSGAIVNAIECYARLNGNIEFPPRREPTVLIDMNCDKHDPIGQLEEQGWTAS